MRKFTWLLALAVPMTIISCQKDAVRETSEDALVQAAGQETGNGSLSGGAAFKMNIIGVENPKGFKVDEYTGYTNDNGARMFVKLDGQTKINLKEGPFDILDADGTDGTALFQLPNPDQNNDGKTAYSVFARALGTPKGSATMTTCATDQTGQLECSTKSLLLVHSGRSKFDNVSAELLYVYADIDEDGDLDRVPLFDTRMYDYYWDYVNKGLRIAQLRFYNVETDVTSELPIQ